MREKWFPIKKNKKCCPVVAFHPLPSIKGLLDKTRAECVLLWPFIKWIRFGTLLPEIRISMKIFPLPWWWWCSLVDGEWRRRGGNWREPPWSHWTWSVITSYEMNPPPANKHSPWTVQSRRRGIIIFLCLPFRKEEESSSSWTKYLLLLISITSPGYVCLDELTLMDSLLHLWWNNSRWMTFPVFLFSRPDLFTPTLISSYGQQITDSGH